MNQPVAAVALVAAAPRRLVGTPASRGTGCGGSSTAVPGTRGARKNGAQYATGTAAAYSRVEASSFVPDHRDQMFRDDSVTAVASAVTPWNRACAGQRSLKMCESFQSAARDATTVITLAAAVAKDDQRLGEVPVVWVVLDRAATLDPEAVLTRCREQLASYKVPRQVHFVERLPLTASGKVHKAALRDMANAMQKSTLSPADGVSTSLSHPPLPFIDFTQARQQGERK